MGLREPPATVTSVKSVSVPKHRTETQSRQIPTHYTGFTVGVNLAIGDPQGLEPSVYAVCSGPAEGGPFQRTVDEARSTRSQSVEVFVPVVATRVG